MATSETVRVIVRCRPMNQRELDLKCQTIVSMDLQLNQVMLENIEQSNEPPKQFTFDAVYQEDSITENIYTESVFPLVESVLEGYNATVFAYGQTGCGKSFTMQGVNTPGSAQRGVIPRSFEHIFEASAVTTGTRYLIRASYLEIYNESIRDLLGKDVKLALDLKEYVDKGVQIPNLTWHPCSSVVDCERLMDKGNRNRATGATLMNKDSSRSHSIFTVITEMCTRSQVDGKEHIRAGKLNLVDLAGSERQSKTHAEGDRLREATRINLSLSALGNVISALVDGRSKHIPYRDSKLTRLLQDSLGGNTKTLMIAAISPAHDNYDETLSTLRYANRAKNIKNKPRINEDPRDAQMKLLQDEINRLKQELLNAGNPSRGNQLLPPDTNIPQIDQEEEIEKEKERLRIEFEREVSEVRRQCENERSTKEELQRKYDDLKVQYDTELDALNANLNKEDIPPSPTTNERNKTKKKGGNLKQKPDGENLTNGQDSDEDIPPSTATNERNKTKKKGGNLKQKPDGENLTNGQDSDEDNPPSTTTNERNKTKKKGGNLKQKPDGENLINGQDIDEDIPPSPTTNEHIDEDIPPSPTTNERNKTKKKGGNLKRKPDGENLTNDQDIDEDNTSIPSDQLDQKQKLQRLHELENKLVGGEEANNEERKRKRKKKLNDMREKLERRKHFNNAINADDDDTMMRVFDNAQEQLHFTSKKLSEQQIENKRLKNDNEDLQHEFQREREGYLNIIREQEKKLLLYRTIIDKMSNLMQRSCNYSNIEKIIEQSRYDEDKNIYHIPEPTREEVQFPQMGNLPIATNGRTIQTDYIVPSKSTPTSIINEYEDDFIVPDEYSNTNTNSNTNTEELEKRYVRNIDSPNGPRERTRIKRQEQLLNENAILQRTKRPFHMNDNDYMNRRLNPYDAPARLSRKYGFSSDKQ